LICRLFELTIPNISFESSCNKTSPPSNASKEWSGTISDLTRKKERIEQKVKQLVEEQVKVDRRDDEDEPGGDHQEGRKKKTDRETLEESRADGEVAARKPSQNGETG
jgi:hypothetical protein